VFLALKKTVLKARSNNYRIDGKSYIRC